MITRLRIDDGPSPELLVLLLHQHQCWFSRQLARLTGAPPRTVSYRRDRQHTANLVEFASCQARQRRQTGVLVTIIAAGVAVTGAAVAPLYQGRGGFDGQPRQVAAGPVPSGSASTPTAAHRPQRLHRRSPTLRVPGRSPSAGRCGSS